MPGSAVGSSSNYANGHLPSNDMCNIAAVKISNLHCKALIDSGSMLSLMSAKVFDQLKAADRRTASRSFDYRQGKPSMVAANRSPLKVLASIDTQLQIAGVVLPVTMYVLKICRMMS